MGRLLGQDLAKILDEVSHGERAAVAQQVASEYNSQDLTPADRELAHSIFKILSEDIEAKVRAALAEALKSSKDIPHELAHKLAFDVAEVGLPILEYSDILTDDDLAQIITTRSPLEQTAIARRRKVSPAISQVLVDYGNSDVVKELVQNKGAEIEDETLGLIFDHFSHVEAIKNGLVYRDTLPIYLAERLVAVVADEIRMYLVSTHEVRDSVLEDAVLQGRENTVTNLLEQSSKPVRDVPALVTQMEHAGRLTSSIILKALEISDLDFFEYGMAIKAKIPVANARMLLRDKGEASFLALYKQACLPMEEFDWCSGRVDALYGVGGGKTVYVSVNQNSYDETGGLGLNDDSWIDVT